MSLIQFLQIRILPALKKDGLSVRLRIVDLTNPKKRFRR